MEIDVRDLLLEGEENGDVVEFGEESPAVVVLLLLFRYEEFRLGILGGNC